MNTAVLFICMFLFMAIGIPVAISLGLASLLTIAFFSQDSIASMSIKLFETSEHYTLMAIPFFVLAGNLMSTGGVAKRMVRFAIAAVGHLRGGLAIASILACMLFAAVSGSSPATVVAIGSIVIAGMVKNGYTKEFAAGVICNAGTLGILIPPSIVMVVYAAVTEVSVGRLFMAGVIPGLLLGLMLMVAVWWRAGKLKIKPPPKASKSELLRALRDSMWGLALLVIIMGGIYGGIFTPTEAAAVSAVYALVVAVFIVHELEMVHIQQQDRQFRTVPTRGADLARGQFLDRAAVVDAGQVIQPRGTFELGLAALGAHQQEADRCQQRQHQQDPDAGHVHRQRIHQLDHVGGPKQFRTGPHQQGRSTEAEGDAGQPRHHA